VGSFTCIVGGSGSGSLDLLFAGGFGFCVLELG
jgi:hypothetical protein